MPNPWDEKEPVECGTPEHRAAKLADECMRTYYKDMTEPLRLEAELGGSETIEFGNSDESEPPELSKKLVHTQTLGGIRLYETQPTLGTLKPLASALDLERYGAMVVALCVAVEKCGSLKAVGAIDSFTVGWRKNEMEITLGKSDCYINHRLPEVAVVHAKNQVQTTGALLDALARELQRQWERREP